jgi:DNA segregation ATPase FtsK/SpoIIIE-like protein
MRHSRLATASDFAPPTDFRRLIARNAIGMAGFVLLLAVAGVTLALATWSVADPSFSHATSTPAHNKLGLAGAAIADLAMQLIGLASALALVPALAIGWRMMRTGRTGLTGWRAVWWLTGTLGAATALAGLSVPVGWPLPVGLGGVIGDMIMRMPIALTGSQSTGRLVGLFVFGAFALFALLTAIGSASPAPSDRAVAPDTDDGIKPTAYGDDEQDASSVFSIPLAIIHHWLLVARANVLRMLGLRGSALGARTYGPIGSRSPRDGGRPHDTDYDDEAGSHRRMVRRGRQEPAFDRPQPRVRFVVWFSPHSIRIIPLPVTMTTACPCMSPRPNAPDVRARQQPFLRQAMSRPVVLPLAISDASPSAPNRARSCRKSGPADGWRFKAPRRMVTRCRRWVSCPSRADLAPTKSCRKRCLKEMPGCWKVYWTISASRAKSAMCGPGRS